MTQVIETSFHKDGKECRRIGFIVKKREFAVYEQEIEPGKYGEEAWNSTFLQSFQDITQARTCWIGRIGLASYEEGNQQLDAVENPHPKYTSSMAGRI